MRKTFEQQYSLGRIAIEETPIREKSKDSATKILRSLKEIFKNPEYSAPILKILATNICPENNNTGRPGMDLWQIFVLGQFRLGLNLSYDLLEYHANNDYTLRCILGVENSSFGLERFEFDYQNIFDNVGLLTDEMLNEINDVIVSFGQKEVFKKKAEEEFILKTDSYVVETNVHFSTDYRLVWDGTRKSLDMVAKILARYPEIPGWRKIKDWYRKQKNLSRQIGQISSKGGKNKDEMLKSVAEEYVRSTTDLVFKMIDFMPLIPENDKKCQEIKLELDKFIILTIKLIDQLERRLVKGESIPQCEKIFSIFEQYTEWINKGKQHPSVELGKKLAITTDQNHLIVDYRIMEHEADCEIVLDLLIRMLVKKYKIQSWSFDKGFYTKTNKELLAEYVEFAVIAKKGKLTKQEKEEESAPSFKKLRHKHSAIESNINELEHRGLGRCPDRTYEHFKRYIGMGVCAYNLHKIGAKIMKQEKEARKVLQKRLQQAA